MSTEQLPSPTLHSTQKGVADAKQTTSIRKITLEALRPSLAKLQEHIAYLTDETSRLREENGKLVAAQGNQKSLEEEIRKIYEGMEKMNKQIGANYQEGERKNQERKASHGELEKRVGELGKESKEHSKKIREIRGLNESYLERIERNREEQQEKIGEMKVTIEQYYSQEMNRIERVVQENEFIRGRVIAVEEKRENDHEELRRVSDITGLFEEEREEVAQLVDRTSYLQSNMVLLEQYRKDKKTQRAENELVKQEVRKIVDTALTPEIRRFLPLLIDKLDHLNRFELKLRELYERIDGLESTQDHKVERVDEKYKAEVERITSQLQAQVQEVDRRLAGSVESLRAKVSENSSSQSEEQDLLNRKLKMVERQSSEALSRQIAQLSTELRVLVQRESEGFVEKHKEEIYAAIEETKPEDKADQERHVMEVVERMEPLLGKVEEQLDVCTSKIAGFDGFVDKKLGYFGNQISKMKTDITLDKNETRKLLESFQSKLSNNHGLLLELARQGSRLTETVMLSYALGVNPTDDHQVFVTYNDGLVCEVEDGQWTYRRKALRPEIVRRAVLHEMVKEVDRVITRVEDLEWHKQENKPSAFFNKIHQTYLALYEEGPDKYTMPARPPSHQMHQPLLPVTPRKGRYVDLQTDCKLKVPLSQTRPKAHSKEVFSRTIDLESKEFRSYDSVAKQAQEQHYSRRRSIKLAKLSRQDI